MIALSVLKFEAKSHSYTTNSRAPGHALPLNVGCLIPTDMADSNTLENHAAGADALSASCPAAIEHNLRLEAPCPCIPSRAARTIATVRNGAHAKQAPAKALGTRRTASTRKGVDCGVPAGRGLVSFVPCDRLDRSNAGHALLHLQLILAHKGTQSA
jgi:hypothetical protein